MKSYKFAEYGQALQAMDEATPSPRGDEILVKIVACGVCHSDIHLWQGYFDLGGGRTLDLSKGRRLPFTLGHEIVGEVVALGANASNVELGDRRVVFPWIGCGQCQVCGSDNEHLCSRPEVLGANVDGGFSDHVLVPHPRYLFAYGDAPTELACTYACSGLTAYSALKKVADRATGRSLVIIGAGGVGFAALRLAQVVLDSQIIVADINDATLEAARQAGAAAVVNTQAEHAATELKKLTGGGAAVAIDFVGSEASASLGLRILGASGVLLVVGLFGGALTLSLPLLPLKNITIRGSFVGSLREMGELMELVRTRKVAAIPVQPRPLAQAHQTLEDLRDGRILGRVVLTP